MPADEHFLLSREESLIGGKSASQERRHTHHLEKIRGDFDGLDSNWFILLVGEIDLGVPSRGGILKDLIQSAIVHEVDG